MPIAVVTPSSVLPVNITTALRHLRVLENEVDLVKLYLQAGAEAVEDYTGRALLTKTYCLSLRDWPNFTNLRVNQLRAIELRRTPLISIDSVKYYDSVTGVLTTLDASHYRADTASEPGRLVFVEDSFDLPDVAERQDSVQIQFKAGYGTVESAIDPMLRLATLQFAHNFYDNRVPLGDAKMVAIPYNLERLLRAKRVESLVSIE